MVTQWSNKLYTGNTYNNIPYMWYNPVVDYIKYKNISL